MSDLDFLSEAAKKPFIDYFSKFEIPIEVLENLSIYTLQGLIELPVKVQQDILAQAKYYGGDMAYGITSSVRNRNLDKLRSDSQAKSSIRHDDFFNLPADHLIKAEKDVLDARIDDDKQEL